MKKRKSLKQILAIIGVALLVAMYLLTLVFALMKMPWAQTAFRASLGCTIAIPIFLYVFLLVAKVLRPGKSPVIDAVVFDVGNVLIDVDHKKQLREMNLPEESYNYLNTLFDDPDLWNNFDLSNKPYKETIHDYTKDMPQCEEDLIRFFENIADNMSEFPYSVNWLRTLKASGYKVYILSNWAKSVYEDIDRLHINNFLKYTDGTVWSFETHMIKPNADIYEHLIKKFDLDPSRTIYIDDNADNIKAGTKAGLISIQFTDYASAARQMDKLGVKC